MCESVQVDGSNWGFSKPRYTFLLPLSHSNKTSSLILYKWLEMEKETLCRISYQLVENLKKNYDNKWLLFYTFTVEMIFLYLKSFSPIVHDCITITVNFGISMAFGTFQRILTYIISLCALCSFCPFYTSQSWVCKKCILLNKWWTSWWALTFVMLQNPGAPLVGTMRPQQLLHPVIPFC